MFALFLYLGLHSFFLIVILKYGVLLPLFDEEDQKQVLNHVLLLLFESSFAFSDRNFKSNRKKTVTQKLKSRVHSNRTSMRTVCTQKRGNRIMSYLIATNCCTTC